MNEQIYPTIMVRVKAMAIDFLVIVGFMFLTTYLFAFFENVPPNVRMIAFLFIFFFYDPIFTSLFGGTIGHIMNEIRVKRVANEQKNILFPLAVLRYIFKLLLGWKSFIVIPNNEKGRAVHDYWSGSVVINAKSMEKSKLMDNA